jgi:RNA polymerase sigma-70 factor (ECF subfamily)
VVALQKLDYERLSDIELAARVAARDSAAAALIVRRNNQRLFRIARSIVKDRTDAEDAVQSGYLNAFAAIGGFDGRASLATWLTRIVINEALGRVRIAKRRRDHLDHDSIVVLDEYREKLMRGSSQAQAPDAEVARDQLRRLLEDAISALPADFRTVFVLREVEGLSVIEIAEMLGIPGATVKTRAFRARQQIRQALDPEIRTALVGTFPFGGASCEALLKRVLEGFETLEFTFKGDHDHD